MLEAAMDEDSSPGENPVGMMEESARKTSPVDALVPDFFRFLTGRAFLSSGTLRPPRTGGRRRRVGVSFVSFAGFGKEDNA